MARNVVTWLKPSLKTMEFGELFGGKDLNGIRGLKRRKEAVNASCQNYSTTTHRVVDERAALRRKSTRMLCAADVQKD